MITPMKYPLIFGLFIFCSCNSFNENNALEYRSELLNAVKELESYDMLWLDRDDMHSYITEDLSELSVHYIVKNLNTRNLNFSGFIEENDSLVIFINSSDYIGDPERRIIYDFSKNPRNFESETIIGASYKLVQLDERWYYSEVGIKPPN